MRELLEQTLAPWIMLFIVYYLGYYGGKLDERQKGIARLLPTPPDKIEPRDGYDPQQKFCPGLTGKPVGDPPAPKPVRWSNLHDSDNWNPYREPTVDPVADHDDDGALPPLTNVDPGDEDTPPKTTPGGDTYSESTIEDLLK